MTNTLYKNETGVQILTPDGWSNFAGVVEKPPMTVMTVVCGQFNIVCTPDHKIYISDDHKVEAGHLKIDDRILSANGPVTITDIIHHTEQAVVYDVLSVDKHNRFIANDLVISNCEFITADETLIAPAKLLLLRGEDPIYKTHGQVRWYDKPKVGNTYLVALDPSQGVGRDDAAIQVYSMPDMSQVAEWTHNRTSIPQQVRTMQLIVNHIYAELKGHPDQRGDPEIYFSLENNSQGIAALQSIQEIGEDQFNGTMLHEPKQRGMTRTKGFNTNVRSKSLACSKLKGLIESGRLQVKSKPLVRQLKFFVSKGDSFAAKGGEHDDCVMSTILCIRMMLISQNWDDRFSDLMRDVFDDEDSNDCEPMPIVFS